MTDYEILEKIGEYEVLGNYIEYEALGKDDDDDKISRDTKISDCKGETAKGVITQSKSNSAPSGRTMTSKIFAKKKDKNDD